MLYQLTSSSYETRSLAGLEVERIMVVRYIYNSWDKTEHFIHYFKQQRSACLRLLALKYDGLFL